MNYLKSTRKELIKICQEKGIKGYYKIIHWV
jgi:hypothetical protein